MKNLLKENIPGFDWNSSNYQFSDGQLWQWYL